MRINSLTALLLLTFSTSALADMSALKKGLKSFSAIQNGPQVDCEENLSIPLSKKFSAQGADCSMYVKADGSFGPMGKTIVSHMQSLGNTHFYTPSLSGVKGLCPKWSSFSKERRDYFWVWLFAAISWKESTCGASTVNSAATHGTAVGHMQLNRPKKDRAWRGGDTGDSCAVQDISPNSANIKCAVEILHEQLKGKKGIYKGNGSLFGPGAHAYWHHLRLSNGGKIIEFMRDFPGCR